MELPVFFFIAKFTKETEILGNYKSGRDELKNNLIDFVITVDIFEQVALIRKDSKKPLSNEEA